MNIAMFYHSLLSDWNHGNAHFLRGIASELISRGHEVIVYEPEDSWSLNNLLREYGDAPLMEFRQKYPALKSLRYKADSFDPGKALDSADLVIVHEWNDHELVKLIGTYRHSTNNFRLLFHDTHHRSVTDENGMKSYDLSHYDGVLAYGAVIASLYLQRGWADRVWVWHEAADARIFHPVSGNMRDEGDLIWIGNWGDDERTAELSEYLLQPVSELGLKAAVHGVRYPDYALQSLAKAGLQYDGWLPNYKVPERFSRFKVTLHIPRRPYVESLPGIPTIRVFEALACGIPLISSPWDDCEGLFTPGRDFLIARSGKGMAELIRLLLNDRDVAMELASSGLHTVLERHTCAHRVDQLLGIYYELEGTLKEMEIT